MFAKHRAEKHQSSKKRFSEETTHNIFEVFQITQRMHHVQKHGKKLRARVISFLSID